MSSSNTKLILILFDTEIAKTFKNNIGYILSRKKWKGSISIPDKAWTTSICFVFPIITNDLHVHLENGEYIYLTENNLFLKVAIFFLNVGWFTIKEA